MTIGDVALPHGTPIRPDSATQRGARRTRTRASVDVTVRNGKILGGMARAARTVWSDWLNSWIRAESTPSLSSYLRVEKTRPVPGGDTKLRTARIGWAYSLGTFGTVSGHLWAWLWQSPLRLLTAAVLIAVPALVFLFGGAA